MTRNHRIAIAVVATPVIAVGLAAGIVAIQRLPLAKVPMVVSVAVGALTLVAWSRQRVRQKDQKRGIHEHAAANANNDDGSPVADLSPFAERVADEKREETKAGPHEQRFKPVERVSPPESEAEHTRGDSDRHRNNRSDEIAIHPAILTTAQPESIR